MWEPPPERTFKDEPENNRPEEEGCLALGDVDLNGMRQEKNRLSVWGSTCLYDCMVYDLFPKGIF